MVYKPLATVQYHLLPRRGRGGGLHAGQVRWKRRTTIWSALKPVAEVGGPFKIIATLERLPNVELVPGDFRLSEFEQELNGFWAAAMLP
jgi:hypothetical protein